VRPRQRSSVIEDESRSSELRGERGEQETRRPDATAKSYTRDDTATRTAALDRIARDLPRAESLARAH